MPLATSCPPAAWPCSSALVLLLLAAIPTGGVRALAVGNERQGSVSFRMCCSILDFRGHGTGQHWLLDPSCIPAAPATGRRKQICTWCEQMECPAHARLYEVLIIITSMMPPSHIHIGSDRLSESSPALQSHVPGL